MRARGFSAPWASVLRRLRSLKADLKTFTLSASSRRRTRLMAPVTGRDTGFCPPPSHGPLLLPLQGPPPRRPRPLLALLGCTETPAQDHPHHRIPHPLSRLGRPQVPPPGLRHRLCCTLRHRGLGLGLCHQLPHQWPDNQVPARIPSHRKGSVPSTLIVDLSLTAASGFAALPRITDQPTTPEEPFYDDYNALERQFRSTNTSTDDPDAAESPPSSFLTAPPRQINTPLDVLQKLHCNLESRVQLFWSSCLSARTVRLHLFASPRDSFSSDAHHRHAEDDAHRPIATIDVVTGTDGSFNARFCIPWQKLCQHHGGVYIAYGLPAEEHDLVIVAELLPPPVFNTSVSTPNVTSQSTPNSNLKPSFSSHSHTSSQNNIYLDVPPHSQSQSHPHLNTLLNSLSNSISSSFSSSISALHSTLMPSSTFLTHTTLPITHSPIRVISDIDDTVKMSGITEGARAVFHNVFVKELKDGIIPGMGEWYTNMWERGVRFHYVVSFSSTLN